jgi:peptidoglycan/xylan/chitin deacetylase (PgdA/CDA1 family)
LADTYILTVDVERDWAGQGTLGIRECLPRFLDLLDRHGATATFFVVADLVDLVRPLLSPDSRHEVASHGLTHRRLTDLTSDEVDGEVRRSRQQLDAAGYVVDGFRAPFWASPPGLADALVAAGYGYDASAGRLVPSLRRVATGPDATGPGATGGDVPASGTELATITSSVLRDGRTPLSLTYLRLLHPVGRRLIPPGTQQLSCHLHELLDDAAGWDDLPRPLRRLHRRHCGAPAWRLLDGLLADRPAISCRRHLQSRTAA